MNPKLQVILAHLRTVADDAFSDPEAADYAQTLLDALEPKAPKAKAPKGKYRVYTCTGGVWAVERFAKASDAAARELDVWKTGECECFASAYNAPDGEGNAPHHSTRVRPTKATFDRDPGPWLEKWNTASHELPEAAPIREYEPTTLPAADLAWLETHNATRSPDAPSLTH